MTISVLMSTYKNEKSEYLDYALKSIWTDQISKPEQIVLVEDGKLTKDLYNVISRWKRQLGNVLTVLAKEENQGLAAALNDGIPLCKGDLIARMDSDDISLPNRFKLQREFMIEHNNVDVLGGSIQEFNDAGTLNKVRKYPQTCSEVYNYIYKGSPVAHPTVMFRRSFFDQGLRYSSKYYVCEDITLWYNALKNGKVICNIPDIILKFRRNNSTLKRRGRKKAFAEFKAYVHGINELYGPLTYKYIFPLMRLIFRLMPTNIVRLVYNSKFRYKVLNH